MNCNISIYTIMEKTADDTVTLQSLLSSKKRLNYRMLAQNIARLGGRKMCSKRGFTGNNCY